MNPKRAYVVSGTAIALFLGFCLLLWFIRDEAKNPAQASSAQERKENEQMVRQFSGKAVPASERRKLSDEQLLELLESTGFVPPDADDKDWAVAAETKWWGKRLEPVSFWGNRAIWYDKAAEWAARSRGRGWPPIPHVPEAAEVGKVSDKDKTASGPGPSFVYSEREMAFWTLVGRTRPQSPENIEQEQTLLALQVIPYMKDGRSANARTGSGHASAGTEIARVRSSELGFPPEALGDEAVFWTYVLRKREEYTKLKEAWGERFEVPAKGFFGRLLVEPKYITDPLSESDLQKATNWKIAYLKRLRSEKTDETYIQAYLKAWALTEQQVFGAAAN